MSDQVTGVVVGTQAVVERFDATAPRVYGRVVRTMRQFMIRLQGYVKGAKLSGQVLHVRTGHLRASIAQRVDLQGDTIIGAVGIFEGPTLPYGRAHEYGFDGVVWVREHLRKIAAKRRSGTFLRYGDFELAQLESEGGRSLVRGHTMHMHVSERSFLRSAFGEMKDAILALLRDDIAGAVERYQGA